MNFKILLVPVLSLTFEKELLVSINILVFLFKHDFSFSSSIKTCFPSFEHCNRGRSIERNREGCFLPLFFSSPQGEIKFLPRMAASTFIIVPYPCTLVNVRKPLSSIKGILLSPLHPKGFQNSELDKLTSWDASTIFWLFLGLLV